MREAWHLLVSFLLGKWGELAASTRALKGLRKDKSAEKLLRVRLIHLGCGHSLRETAVRARKAQLAELSSVALWKRLRKFRERGVALAAGRGFQVRAIDATTVEEPGQSGSQWHIHYCVRLPVLACDYFKLTRRRVGARGSPCGTSRSGGATSYLRTGGIRRRPGSATRRWREGGSRYG